MRRKDRELGEQDALTAISRAKYGILSAVTEDGEVYSVPLSLAISENKLYFHCAKRGTKLDILRANPSCVCAFVTQVILAEDDFTCYFESVIVRGKAHELESDEDRTLGLRAICEQHTPQLMDQFEDYKARFDKATSVWCIEIEQVTGKCKSAPERIHPQN